MLAAELPAGHREERACPNHGAYASPRLSAMMRNMPAPELVAHADWGTHPRKRQVATAELLAGSTREEARYRVAGLRAADPVDALDDLTSRNPAGTTVVGFDFPIGLPAAFAHAAGIDSFRSFLRDEMGAVPWDRFADVARVAEEISIHRPFYPYRPGGTKREHLHAALNLTAQQIRRVCERDDAESLFWTLGGKQVGKGALSGWSLIQQACRRADPPVVLWPFDGRLDELLLDAGPLLAIVETYPRAYYPFIEPATGAGALWSKRRQSDRLKRIPALLAWAASLGVDWDPDVLTRVNAGLSAGSEGEDEFDAVVGLVAVLGVLHGAIPTGEPALDSVKTVEGWILGRP